MRINREAFSILELLIVIVIMGVIYNLSVNNFQKPIDKRMNVTLKNLKEYLQKFKYEDSVRFLCLNDCSSCDILVDGVKTESVESFLDDSIRVYRYEYFSGLQEVLQDVYFNREGIQEDVCFSYEMGANRVGNQILVEFKDTVYDFSTYISPTTEYASMAEALDSKQRHIEEVTR